MKGSEIQNLVFSLSLFGYKRSDIKAFFKRNFRICFKSWNKDI